MNEITQNKAPIWDVSEEDIRALLPALFFATHPDDPMDVPLSNEPWSDLLECYASHSMTNARLINPALSGQLMRAFLLSPDRQTDIIAAIGSFGQLEGGYALPADATLARAYHAFFSSTPVTTAVTKALGAEALAQFLAGLEDAFERTPDDPIAFVDHIANMVIRGFAVHPGCPRETMHLGFYLNGTFIGRTQTMLLRQELITHYGGNGLFGFEFEIQPAPDQARHQMATLEIRSLDTDALLAQRRVRLGYIRDDATVLMRATMSLEQASRNLDRHRFWAKKPASALKRAIDRLVMSLPRARKTTIGPLSSFNDFYECYDDRAQVTPAGAPKVTVACGARDPVKRSIKGEAFSLKTSVFEATPQSLHAGWACDNDDELIILCDPRDRAHKPGIRALRAAAHADPRTDAFVLDHTTDDLPALHGHFDPHLLVASNPYRHAIAFRRRALVRIAASTVGGLAAGEQLAEIAVWLLALLDAGGSVKSLGFPVLACRSLGEKATRERLRAHFEALTSYYADQEGLSVSLFKDAFAAGEAKTCKLQRVPAEKPATLSIIVPTRNALDITRDCIDSLRRTITVPDACEIILMNNQSDDPEMIAWLDQESSNGTLRVIDYDAAFNWSAINNVAAQHATGEILLFLNNDTVALERGWDQVLREKMALPNIGALGARLLFEDGTIQHGGVILYDVGVATHEAIGQPCSDGGYQLRAVSDHLASAVTGAFLACHKMVFEDVGGFNAEDLTVTFNDIDFCLRVGQTGKVVLYTPHITFTHLESKTRGYDYADAAKRERAQAEREWMEDTWQELLNQDPYYSNWMARRGRPFSLLKGADYDG